MQQKLKYLIVSLAVVGITASPSEVVDSETKAASPLINCGCQCSPLTFRDAKGQVQGNCLTVDGTGAQWCYVDAAHSSSCQDLVPSQRFPNNPWSYEACATPSIGSPLCPVAPVYSDHHHHHQEPIITVVGDYSPELIGSPRETDDPVIPKDNLVQNKIPKDTPNTGRFFLKITINFITFILVNFESDSSPSK